VNGNRIKSRVKAAIFIQMDKNTMVNGPGTRNQGTELTNTKMVTFIWAVGRMTGDPAKEK